MLVTLEMKDCDELKVIIVKNDKGEYKAIGVKGTTQEELENIVAGLWIMLAPSEN